MGFKLHVVAFVRTLLVNKGSSLKAELHALLLPDFNLLFQRHGVAV
jgi:hypothetical protein